MRLKPLIFLCHHSKAKKIEIDLNSSTPFAALMSSMISDPTKIDAEEIGALFALLMASGASSGDLMSDIMNGNPSVLISMLKMPNQDLSGCLSNCTNRGSCSVDEKGDFICSCQEFFDGADCSVDTRACSSNPCKNNGTCLEIERVNSTNSFNCSCSSKLFYGNILNKLTVNAC